MKTASSGTWWQFAAYGALGLPLAMCALPVYVQIPAYYSTQLGLAVASTGLGTVFGALYLIPFRIHGWDR